MRSLDPNYLRRPKSLNSTLEVMGAGLMLLALTANRLGLGHNPAFGWKKVVLLLIGLAVGAAGIGRARQAGPKLLAALFTYSGAVMIGLAVAAHRLHLGHNPELRWIKALLFIGGLGFAAVGVRVFGQRRGTEHVFRFALAYFGIVSTGAALAVYPLGLAQDPAFRWKRGLLFFFGVVMSGLAALSTKVGVQEWFSTGLNKLSSAIWAVVRAVVGPDESEIVNRPQVKLDRTSLIVAVSAYLAIVLFMWGTFARNSGMPYETAFPYVSETSSVLHGFIYIADPQRPNMNTFYQVSYLLGELFAPGSFVPYQVVYALLWFARGLLVFMILNRLFPHAAVIAYLAGALTLVHSADGTLQWIGQLNEVGFIFWLLLAFYFFVVADDTGKLWSLFLLTLLAAGFEYMSLWSYESGLFIILLIPLGVFLVRRPLRRFRAILWGVWYVLPTVYMVDSALKYYRSAGETYQQSVLRTDWATKSIASDLGFNVYASLSFWSWGKHLPATMPKFEVALLAIAATAAFVCGAVLISYSLRGLAPQPVARLRRLGKILVLAGLVWVVASFPAYLLLSSARTLWRTQLLSGPGAGLAFTGGIALMVSYLGRQSIRQGTALFLCTLIAYYGAACAIQRGARHRQGWESHRKAIAALLRAIPQVSPNTVIAMIGVPAQNDPFRHDLWFDMALRLAYPRISVAGVYFLDGGEPAQGNELSMSEGQWHWDGQSLKPLIRNGGLDQTIVVRYDAGGADQVLDRFPSSLCPNSCKTDTYKPYARIAGSVPSTRAIRRYGPL